MKARLGYCPSISRYGTLFTNRVTRNKTAWKIIISILPPTFIENKFSNPLTWNTVPNWMYPSYLTTVVLWTVSCAQAFQASYNMSHLFKRNLLLSTTLFSFATFNVSSYSLYYYQISFTFQNSKAPLLDSLAMSIISRYYFLILLVQLPDWNCIDWSWTEKSWMSWNFLPVL